MSSSSSLQDSPKPIDLQIHGMSCASCVARVEKALLGVSGVKSAAVNLATEKAHVIFVGPATQDDLVASIERAGYEARPIDAQGVTSSKSDQDSAEQIQLKKGLWTVALSALLTLPLLIPMLVLPFGLQWQPPVWLQLILATAVQFGFGFRFYLHAWKALKAKSGNMDLLVAIGTTAAYGLSLYLVLGPAGHHVGHNYFESGAVVITLVLLGKWLESRAKKQTSSAIRSLQSLRPEKAVVLREGLEVQVSVMSLQAGDVVLVRPGERAPVDGEIIMGVSQMDESLITGESLPVPKSEGDRVTAGSINVDGPLRIRTLAVGSETVLSRIIRLVESAQAEKAPIQKLVDKVSAVFIPVVLAVAGITFFGTGFFGPGWETAILNSVAVLVIACPCALGLATPTSLMVGMGAAAKSGILIRDAEALEVAHSVSAIAFDKTGTLTEGKPTVSEIHPIELSENELLGLVASIQLGSEHPLAKAVVRSARRKGLELGAADRVQVIAGKGVAGSLNGRLYHVGNRALAQDLGVDLGVDRTTDRTTDLTTHPSAAFRSTELTQKMMAAAELERQGRTVSWIMGAKNQPDSGHDVLGFLAFRDKIRPAAKTAIAKLKALGIKTVMLTGDNASTAGIVAGELAIDEFQAGMLPEDKSNFLRSIKADGHIVAMVGDGINDAPALAAADVGVAMGSGTDMAMQSAGITLMQSNPNLIGDAIDISRRTYSKIRQNLFWAFGYNVVGIPLAALGYLDPMIAGAAMAFSSVSVVTNSLLLRRWKPA